MFVDTEMRGRGERSPPRRRHQPPLMVDVLRIAFVAAIYLLIGASLLRFGAFAMIFGTIASAIGTAHLVVAIDCALEIMEAKHYGPVE